MTYPDNYFDIVYINRVLCSIEGWPLVLDEMVRVVKPGGKVISTCPDWSTFSSSALDSIVEVAMKLILEKAIGEPYSFTKKSKGHFQDRGLSPVNITLEAVRSTGYDDDIINGIEWQVRKNIGFFFDHTVGQSFYTDYLSTSLMEYLF